MANKVWGGSIRPQTSLMILAVIVSIALGGAALIGRRALIGMAAVMPGIVGRSLVELWLWEQQKKQRPINAVAIKRWAGIGLWVYLGVVFVVALILIQSHT